jgi:hypothetical protein
MTSTATALVVSNVTYDLVEEPSPTSRAVIAARAEVLQNLDLGTMLANLERTNDLLYVAACGVSGNRKDATLSGKVAQLQYGLLNSCSSAAIAMANFGEAAGVVLSSLRQSFRFLYTSPPREDRTISVLTRCEAQATNMATTAGSLAGNFKQLADDAEEVLEGTLTARDMEEQDRLAAISRKQDLNAKNERARTLRDELGRQMEKVQKLVDEAREAQNKAEDRAFGLAIAGNITSALGSAVQGFMSVKAAPMTMASNLVGALSPAAAGGYAGATQPGVSGPAVSPGARAPAVAPSPAGGLAPSPAARGPAPAPSSAASAAPAPAVRGPAPAPSSAASAAPSPAVRGPAPAPSPASGPASSPGAREAAPASGSAASPIASPTVSGPASTPSRAPETSRPPPPTAGSATAPANRSTAQTAALSSSDQLAVGAGIAAAGARAAEGNAAMASSYGDIAERYADEKRRWLDLLMQLQEEQRQALGDIAQYAEEMKKADLDTQAARSAVDSLQQAVTALKQIVTILETAKVFWEMMAAACKRLASPTIRQDIDLFKDDPPEDRLAEYTRDEFKLSLLQLAWRWCALKVIADEYRTAVTQTREKVVETVNKAPTIEEAKRLAPALAGKLSLDINRDLQAIEAATAQLRVEQAQLPPPRAAAA